MFVRQVVSTQKEASGQAKERREKEVRVQQGEGVRRSDAGV
jgi:hypothetical protein